MSSKPSNPTGDTISQFGKMQTEGMLNLQRELIDEYERASRAWLERVKAEMDLWSRLATKLTGTQTVPEALEAYQKYVAERMQMTAEDARRLFDDCQKITQKITQLSSGKPTGST